MDDGMRRTLPVLVVQAKVKLLAVAHLVGQDDLLFEVKDRDTRAIDRQA
jgi:hypothetical protein